VQLARALEVPTKRSGMASRRGEAFEERGKEREGSWTASTWKS